MIDWIFEFKSLLEKLKKNNNYWIRKIFYTPPNIFSHPTFRATE
jgi:hypothetical protein